MCANRYEVDAPLVAHDDELPAPDELTDLFINHIWRRFVGGLLNHFGQQVDFIGTDPEIEQAQNWYDALVLDFYNPNLETPMNYHGAFVGRSTGFTLTTTQTLVTFDDDDTFPHHDTDGFFDPAFPNQLKIPADMGGYYSIGALVQMLPGTLFPYIGIETNGTDYLTRNFSPETNYDQIRASGVWLLNDGASFRLRAWMNVGSRDTVAVSGFHNWSAEMWCHRLGDAP